MTEEQKTEEEWHAELSEGLEDVKRIAEYNLRNEVASLAYIQGVLESIRVLSGWLSDALSRAQEILMEPGRQDPEIEQKDKEEDEAETTDPDA